MHTQLEKSGELPAPTAMGPKNRHEVDLSFQGQMKGLDQLALILLRVRVTF